VSTAPLPAQPPVPPGQPPAGVVPGQPLVGSVPPHAAGQVPPPGPPGAGPVLPPAPASRRRTPRRGLLVAALVVAVVLLVGSVGATAAFVQTHASSGVTRLVGPNGRTFVVPGQRERAPQYRTPQNPRRQPAAPAAPGRRHATGPQQPAPTPSAP